MVYDSVMPRRLHIADLRTGLLSLDAVQTRHARQALRLQDGDTVELFDNIGRTAAATIVPGDAHALTLQVDLVTEPNDRTFKWSVAAAVPKGERADWMVEKLSELGCNRFTPLITERSVVAPKGVGKIDRWVRLATESAKQCRRPGVMEIDPPIELEPFLRDVPTTGGASAWFFDTGSTVIPIRQMLIAEQPPRELTMMIGAEGGWSEREIDRMLDARLKPIALTATILRVETAAVAAGALVAAMWRDSSSLT